MAFFCTKSGVRIVAPGISKSAGGDVQEYEGDEAAMAAERVAAQKLAELAKTDNEAQPSPEALKAASAAAEDELTKPRAHQAPPKK